MLGAMSSQITKLAIVYSTVYSGTFLSWMHMSVLNGAMWGMEQVHCGICEWGQFPCKTFTYIYIERVWVKDISPENLITIGMSLVGRKAISEPILISSMGAFIGNKIRSNFNQDAKFSLRSYVFQNVVCKMATISCRPPCVTQCSSPWENHRSVYGCQLRVDIINTSYHCLWPPYFDSSFLPTRC